MMVILALLVVFIVAPFAAAQTTPGVTVNDQEIVSGTVVVAQVISSGPGWIVIHADQDGQPGPVIGHSAVIDGENSNVVVDIDTANATQTLYAMLHTDAGQVGTYEFPGPDGPVQVDGQVVTPAFQATGGLEAQPTAEGTPTTEATQEAGEAEASPTTDAAAQTTPAAGEAAPQASPSPTQAVATLPTSGGVVVPWTAITMSIIGGFALISGLAMALFRKQIR
jgi:hypothetical protein